MVEYWKLRSKNETCPEKKTEYYIKYLRARTHQLFKQQIGVLKSKKNSITYIPEEEKYKIKTKEFGVVYFKHESNIVEMNNREIPQGFHWIVVNLLGGKVY